MTTLSDTFGPAQCGAFFIHPGQKLANYRLKAGSDNSSERIGRANSFYSSSDLRWCQKPQG
jgi:hypothetical protein